jgi:hypothetical protein
MSLAKLRIAGTMLVTLPFIFSGTFADRPRVQNTYSLEEAINIASREKLLVLGIRFDKDDPNGGDNQCGRGARGDQFAVMGNWSREIKITPNLDPGGCGLSFAILDPSQAYAGYELMVTLAEDGGPKYGNACYVTQKNGTNKTPSGFSIERTRDEVRWTPTLHFDTHEHNWPVICKIEFKDVSSKSLPVAFEISYYPDGGTSTQCMNTASPEHPHSIYTAKPNGGHAVTLGLQTNGNTGACNVAFRLNSR